jgi:hypothetical protein
VLPKIILLLNVVMVPPLIDSPVELLVIVLSAILTFAPDNADIPVVLPEIMQPLKAASTVPATNPVALLTSSEARIVALVLFAKLTPTLFEEKSELLIAKLTDPLVIKVLIPFPAFPRIVELSTATFFVPLVVSIEIPWVVNRQ